MDLSLINAVGAHLASGLPPLATALVLLVAARWFFVVTTPFQVNSGLLKQENPAIGVVFGAFLLAAALMLAGTMFGRGQEAVLVRVIKILVEGSVAVLLLRLSIWVNDRFILYRFCIAKEICQDRNLGVAFCLAGSCIACGLILNGALTGYSQSFAYGLRDIVIFWLLGQTILVMSALIYHRINQYDVHALIEYDDNVAVGVGFGAFLVSLGVVVRASIVGAGLESLGREMPLSLLLAAFGTLGVIVTHTAAARIVSPRMNYEDEVEMHGNLAVSTVAACASLAVALLLASIIQR